MNNRSAEKFVQISLVHRFPDFYFRRIKLRISFSIASSGKNALVLDIEKGSWFSVAQLYSTLLEPVDCSMPGSCPSLSPSLLKLTSIDRWCHPAISSSVVPFSSCLQCFPASGSFPMSQLFASGGQCIGASASASVLPMNIQGWLPLWLTGLISLLSKGLSRVFSQHHSSNASYWGLQSYNLFLRNRGSTKCQDNCSHSLLSTFLVISSFLATSFLFYPLLPSTYSSI